MITITATTDIKSVMHDFDIVVRRSGSVHRITQIGRTRKDAEFLIRNYNFKGLDFEKDFEIRDPAQVLEGKS